MPALQTHVENHLEYCAFRNAWTRKDFHIVLNLH